MHRLWHGRSPVLWDTTEEELSLGCDIWKAKIWARPSSIIACSVQAFVMDQVSLLQRHLLLAEECLNRHLSSVLTALGMRFLLFNQQSNTLPMQRSCKLPGGFSPVPDPALGTVE